MRPKLAVLSALYLALAGAALFAASPSGCASKLACKINSDCTEGYCSMGVCKKDCVDSEIDCPKGTHCNVVSQCEPDGSGGSSSASTGATGSTSGMGGASSSSSGPGATSSAASSGTSSTSSSTTSSSSGGGTLREFDFCASDQDCSAPLVCKPLGPGEAARCTRTCGANADCMTQTRCDSIGGSKYCAWEDTGRACQQANACNFACLTNQKYCTNTCSSGSDCPNGYGCMPVQNTNICVKAEAPCSAQDTSQCIAMAACDTSATLVVAGCTTTCNTAADCPQRAHGFNPWTCNNGICSRPSDVYGPLEGGAQPAQWACNAAMQVVNVCNDGQHIDFVNFTVPNPPSVSCAATMTTDGLPGDACLDSCRYQGGCHFGFQCAALAGVGNERVGLCMPSGGGAVGAACQHDTDCFFGYCANSKCARDCTQDGACPKGFSCNPVANSPPVEGLPFKRCE